MSDALDRELTRLLADGARPPDEAFVARMRWAVIAEARMRAQRRALRRRLGAEGAATFALVACYFILARAGSDSVPFLPLSSPALAGLLLLATGMIVLAATPALKKADPH